jgi:hypothetical protein
VRQEYPLRARSNRLVSDLARRILHKSIGSIRRQCVQCSACRRTPVPGEFVHRLPSERVVCSLCLANVPEQLRDGATAERVHASERHLPVAPRAA